LAVALARGIYWLSRTLKVGAGGTWPGELALLLRPHILQTLSLRIRKGSIIVAGTNGKTTTTSMIVSLLKGQGDTVISNSSGANLVNGVVSTLLTDSRGKHAPVDWAVFEVDENSLAAVLGTIVPKTVVLLNLFRDQLDRYGEVDVIAEKWGRALSSLPLETTIVVNCDDPLLSFLTRGSKRRIVNIGLTDKRLGTNAMEHATDSTFCLVCGARLSYRTVYFSHLGDWYCPACGEKRPTLKPAAWESPLPGLYNRYNTLAAAAAAQTVGVADTVIGKTLKTFTPAFGRQEECVVKGKIVKLFLSKNPAGFNASLSTVLSFTPKAIVLVLNDRIPDGRDVSWIWDVDFERIPKNLPVIVSGDRVYDLAVRIKHARGTAINMFVLPQLSEAIEKGLALIEPKETIYLLPTYSAMLEARKLISGRKIL
jgi:UDP-N-acetylmuramyl tripeptide synthase